MSQFDNAQMQELLAELMSQQDQEMPEEGGGGFPWKTAGLLGGGAYVGMSPYRRAAAKALVMGPDRKKTAGALMKGLKRQVTMKKGSYGWRQGMGRLETINALGRGSEAGEALSKAMRVAGKGGKLLGGLGKVGKLAWGVGGSVLGALMIAQLLYELGSGAKNVLVDEPRRRRALQADILKDLGRGPLPMESSGMYKVLSGLSPQDVQGAHGGSDPMGQELISEILSRYNTEQLMSSGVGRPRMSMDQAMALMGSLPS